MQKEVKKFVDFAENNQERIIVYSNDDDDDKYLVGENVDGEIKIFFETENRQYNKSIGTKKNPKEKLQGAFYWLLCNLVYIIWLIINDTLLSNTEFKKEKLVFLFCLSIVWFLIFSILFYENKYANNVRIIIVILMVIDNLFIYLGKNIFIFAVSMLYLFLAVTMILDSIFTVISNYMILYNIKRKNATEKGKHSAVHMMCNYIEKYQTYAKKVKNLKKCSRFSLECVGVYGDRILEENLSIMLSNGFVILFLLKLLKMININKIFILEDIPQAINMTAISMGAFVVIWLLMDFFASIICNLLILLSQFITTLPKRKIKYKDLKMAQMLSKEFIEWQYPNDIEPKQKTK